MFGPLSYQGVDCTPVTGFVCQNSKYRYSRTEKHSFGPSVDTRTHKSRPQGLVRDRLSGPRGRNPDLSGAHASSWLLPPDASY